MFNQLLESQPGKKKSAGGTFVSIGIHTAVIAIAVWATAQATIVSEPPKTEKITFVNVPKDEPPPAPKPRDTPKSASADVAVVPPPPKGFQVLQAPIEIPNVIPDVDLSRRTTTEADFSGRGVAGGVAKGVVGGTGPITSDNQTYMEYQVENAATLDKERSPRPAYPTALSNAGIEGVVRAQFVVDTNGRARPGSLKIISSPNELFTQSITAALPRMRFFPAEIGGRRVAQLVELPFSFTLNR